jgi:hypothetical protein
MMREQENPSGISGSNRPFLGAACVSGRSCSLMAGFSRPVSQPNLSIYLTEMRCEIQIKEGT